VSRGALWTARMLSALGVLFLTFDALIKVLRLEIVVQSVVELGLPVHQMFWIGTLEVVLLVLYLIPHTAALGAFLWTVFLGGAILTQLRVQAPWFSHVHFRPTSLACSGSRSTSVSQGSGRCSLSARPDLSHARRIPPATLIQRSLMVIKRWIAPARLRVPENQQGLHPG
jgi:DoxX-like family